MLPFQSIVRSPLDLGAASSLIAEGLLLIAVLIGVRVPLFNVAALWPMARPANTGFVRELVTRSTMLGVVGLPFALGGLR